MLKSTYKVLNTLIPTISNPTGARSRVRTPLLPVGGWKAHPPLSAMHVLPPEPGLLCLCAYPCSSLPPASPCAGQKTHAARAVGPSAAVSPALCVGRGRCCLRPRRGRDGSGETPGSIWGRVRLLRWAPSRSHVSPHSHEFPSIFCTCPQAGSFLKSLSVIPWLLLNPTDACCKQALSLFVSSFHSVLG